MTLTRRDAGTITLGAILTAALGGTASNADETQLPDTGHDMSGMPESWHGNEQIAFLVYPQFTALDVVGPHYMLGNLMGATTARGQGPRPGHERHEVCDRADAHLRDLSYRPRCDLRARRNSRNACCDGGQGDNCLSKGSWQPGEVCLQRLYRLACARSRGTAEWLQGHVSLGDARCAVGIWRRPR